MDTYSAVAVVDSFFTGQDPAIRRPYSWWEAAFVQRWGIAPVPGTGYPQQYMEQRKLDAEALSCNEALLAFHVNTFRLDPQLLPLWIAMETDYDQVKPELLKEEHDPVLDRRLAQEAERFDPKTRSDRKLWLPGEVTPREWQPPQQGAYR